MLRALIKREGSWRVVRWAFLVLLSLLFTAIFIFFIWLTWPIKDIGTLRLIPKESEAYITLRIDPKDQGIKAILTIAEDRYVNVPGVSWINPYLLPYRVSGGIIYKADTPKKPDYLIIADMGWRIRLLKIAKRVSIYLGSERPPVEHSMYQGYWFMTTTKAKKSPVVGLAVIQGKVIASNSIELLKKVIDGLQGSKAPFFESPSISYLYYTMPEYDGLFLISNTDGWLTSIIRDAEDKSDYSIFQVNPVKLSAYLFEGLLKSSKKK